MDNSQIFQIIISLIGSILGSGAAVTLIKFFVERKDNKIREEKLEKKESEKNKWNDFLKENQDKIEELRDEFKEGIKERENKSFERYTEHNTAISSLTDIVNALTDNINKNSVTLELVGQSLLGIEHDKIINLTDKISKRKSITLKEKATLEALYVPYAKLGGNGDCKIGYNHCINLPVVTDEEANETDLFLKKKELGLN